MAEPDEKIAGEAEDGGEVEEDGGEDVFDALDATLRF